MVKRFAANEEVVFYFVQPQHLLVEWRRIHRGLTPDGVDAQVVGDLDQAVKYTGPNAFDSFAKRTDDARVNRHEIHHQSMAPSPSTKAKAKSGCSGLPRWPGNEHERDFALGLACQGCLEPSEAGHRALDPPVVTPAFRRQLRVFQCVLNVRVPAERGRRAPAAKRCHGGFISESELDHPALAIDLGMELQARKVFVKV